MLFSSPTFLFYFLPITLFLALITRRNRVVLLLASLIFYAWGEPIYIILLLFVIVFNYTIGELIGRGTHRAKPLFIAGIVIDLLVLATFKYADFVVANVNGALSVLGLPPLPEPHLPLPLGISFFSFQALAYLIDIYTGEIAPSHSLLRFAVFKSFFPQLIAGPIVRYQWVAADLKRDRFNTTIFAYGISRFVMGLAKKVIIADGIAPLVNQAFGLPADRISFATAWIGAIGFTLQIYFDFSGYSDMAIGLGRMFGIKFPENFRHPYVCVSIQDFWRRWHITLSTWFRDYLYIPLGGNRRGPLRTYVNLWIVFCLCGLWHGATWSFVVWGLYHGSFLVLERTAFGRLLRWLPRPIQHLYALLVVIFGWVLFRSPDLAYALAMMGAMSGAKGLVLSLASPALIADFNIMTLTIAAIGAVASLPWLQWTESLPARWGGEAVLTIAYPAVLFLVLLASFSFVATQSHLAFIYFRF